MVRSLLDIIMRWVVRRVVALRVFQPWFFTPEGQAFLCGMFERLRTARQFSPATRAAHRRYYVTQPLFIIPWQRWRCTRRHGFWPPGFITISPTRRGAGVFARVMHSMALCRAHGVHFGYSVTVTRQNSDVVVSDDFINCMREQGCFVGWYYQYMPVGDAPDWALIPTDEQREHRRQRLAEVRRANTITVFDFLNDGPLVGGCICAGRYYVHITCKGDVEPCAFYPFSVDNINNKSLADVLRSSFFQCVRAHQGAASDWRKPCPVVNHRQWLREAVAASRAQPSQPRATLLVDEAQQPAHAAVSAPAHQCRA